jgi:hypothetical protein
MSTLQKQNPPARAGRFNHQSGQGWQANYSALYGQPLNLDAARNRPRRNAPYACEVTAELAKGRSPNVYLFVGADAWERAESRRIQHGPGSTLVLQDETAPDALRWPPLDALVVLWPDQTPAAYTRKLKLAQTLIRDGVRFAAIEHAPEWLSVWREGGKRNG